MRPFTGTPDGPYFSETSSRKVKEALRAQLAGQCAEDDLCRWYDPLHIEVDGEALTVTFPHRFFSSCFFNSGRKQLEEALAALLGTEATVHYRGCPQPEVFDPPALPPPAERTGPEHPFGENCTLENFIINGKNFFPLAVAREVLKTQKEPSYNPLIYCGKSGSGKTHILRALAGELSKMHSFGAVFYGNTGRFALEYARGGTGKSGSYRAYCIEDIHQLENNAELQEGLALLLDNCLDGRRQVICSCNGLPSSRGFSDSLRSRLERGLVAELKNPDLDVRMRYAQSRCALHGLDLTKEQLLSIARRCDHLNHLSGILLKTAAYRKLSQRKLDDQDIEKILESAGDHNSITEQDIIRCVAGYFSLGADEITGSTRKQIPVHARQTAMFLCRELVGTSYPALGRIFGGKDHSTVIYAIRKITKNIVTHKKTHNDVSELRRRCAKLKE